MGGILRLFRIWRKLKTDIDRETDRMRHTYMLTDRETNRHTDGE